MLQDCKLSGVSDETGERGESNNNSFAIDKWAELQMTQLNLKWQAVLILKTKKINIGAPRSMAITAATLMSISLFEESSWIPCRGLFFKNPKDHDVDVDVDVDVDDDLKGELCWQLQKWVGV